MDIFRTMNKKLLLSISNWEALVIEEGLSMYYEYQLPELAEEKIKSLEQLMKQFREIEGEK